MLTNGCGPLFPQPRSHQEAFRETNDGMLLGKAGRRHFYGRFNPLAAHCAAYSDNNLPDQPESWSSGAAV